MVARWPSVSRVGHRSDHRVLLLPAAGALVSPPRCCKRRERRARSADVDGTGSCALHSDQPILVCLDRLLQRALDRANHCILDVRCWHLHYHPEYFRLRRRQLADVLCVCAGGRDLGTERGGRRLSSICDADV